MATKFMVNIAEYQTNEKIYESANSLVYRGIFKLNNQQIILKILKDNYPTPSELTQYKQEYEIISLLNDNNIIKTYNLLRYQNSLVIVLEDFGGQSLKILTSKHQFTLEEFLTIAIKITESLAAIHTANIIHKDINPSNIVYNPKTEQLKIIDFGISTRLFQENQTVDNINQLEGTLAYIAPEQTGRMNRSIDYRVDFYSLGVTFYELLTNQLPFVTDNPIELVHSHIAQQPQRPHELISSIPVPISNIVMKLLAKTPEERYQSAWGIKADLETCLQQLKTTGKIAHFSLGNQDISDKFYITQKLYGREQEINQLLTTFERVSQGKSEIILVTGYSGIGKSALVNEIHKPITQQRGYFVNGKFDQLQRDIPYTAITQALQGLIRQLLSEPEIILQNWKDKILAALGNNGQIIIDVIPDLEKIIGKEPSVEQLGANEAQNRFNSFFARFIQIFSQKEHPLAIFFDDLQWADLSSLNLLEKLVTNADSQYLLIIGAYRDNEVSPTHPLMQTLEQIKKSETTVNQIMLQALGISDVKQLIADTLNCSREYIQSLAELVTKKTAGNSFFITQLLRTLYKEKLLVFNVPQAPINQGEHSRGFWQWDIQQIQQVGITDNVVDLMVRKIENLDYNTQNVLKLAACIGNKFTLEVLSIVNKKSQTLTSQELQPALKEGLIIPLSNDYKVPLLWSQEEVLNTTANISSNFIPKYPKFVHYKFLHDRVQQAAYILIQQDDKKAVHLEIGRHLLKNTQQNELAENIFNIVNQLNEGIDLISDQLEKNELARLNFQAGKKAEMSAAYESALKYLENGAKALALNSWEDEYELTIEIYIKYLEAIALTTKFEQVEELSKIILKYAKQSLEKARVYQIINLSYYAQLQPEKIIDIGRKALAELGIYLPSEASEIEKEINQKQKDINWLLNQINIEDLINYHLMNELEHTAIVSILQQMNTATLTINFSLFILVILTQVHLCLQYGNPPQSPSIYILYGMILCLRGDTDLGFEFGNLSLKLLKKFNIFKLEALVTHVYYFSLWHWKESIQNRIVEEKLLKAFQIGIDTGDYEYASYTAIDYCLIRFFRGDNLDDVESSYTKYTRQILKLRQRYSLNYIKICQSIVVELVRKENIYLEDLTQDNNEWLLFIRYFATTTSCYFLKNYIQAAANAINAEKYVKACGVFLPATQHNLYYSLSLIAYYNTCEKNQQTEFIEQVDKNQESMKIWANNCPANFQHKYDLVAAEKARVLGENWQAEELYEKAIQGAKKYEFIHEEALAYERAAEFYLQLGREEIGQLYLRNAHHCYTRWGAKAKVKQLEDEYPEYFIGTTNQKKAKSLSTTISTSGNDGTVLDLTTVIKASQALTGEIVLGKLLAKLMKIMIENAGAQKGFLLLHSHDNWVIEAAGAIDSDDVNILQSIPVDSPDASTQTPLLSTAIINYVARTQENIVLNDATQEGQFTRDSYIVTTQPKSILCTPLLNQGKLSGILYLENNLTTGAFTTDRVEVLNILSSQAAISIENSRLYATLEQKVEERTQELSQTLEILKATQAKLEFENALLKSAEENSNYDYQVGGSLPIDAPTYVVRSADRYLYKALRSGDFCYILNTRQMGKSSLMVRMMHHLQQEDVCCAAIDMTRIGSENITPEQWYKGLAVELWQGFDLLGKVNLKAWWQENIELSPVQRLSRFFEEVLLNEVKLSDNTPAPKIVIFLDEIDSILGLDFSVNDFFALVRSCYNQRGINPEYKRLCFVLLGVATPSDLITDYRRTPFNIGQAIQLHGFQLHEAQPLLQGFSDKVSNPQAVLKEVLFWTNGQPFLTQKICQMIRSSSDSIPEKNEKAWIENLIGTNIIKDWEAQDEPEHLRTIKDRILKGEQQATSLLELYRQVLEHGKVKAVDSLEERELILSGLLVKEQSYLKIHNRIYEAIFNSSWISQHI
ncbi:AAA family ATPase [Trichormus variabilis]|uniref:Serine/threonine protein kinase n=1 Tax=Trichormus variabilis SAG 1403-4b TaxID=447716 RepID=A0A3S1AJX8_ANAVA|nr:AAA family ATPase [Trichormus variabilis]RUS93814.1 serine/threonine protein kinase [Trichormus variabilis SAG 1403-4b]